MAVVYGSLANTQILACVLVTDGVSPQDTELNMFLEKARQFINQELGLSKDLADPPAIIGTVAEYYASGLFLSKNNMPEGETVHPNLAYAEKLLGKFKVPEGLVFASRSCGKACSDRAFLLNDYWALH